MNELTILNGEIDRVFRDLVDLDLRISKATGRSIGFANIRDMKHELANNARRVFCMSIEELAYNERSTHAARLRSDGGWTKYRRD
jgi:hypothetical protein